MKNVALHCFAFIGLLASSPSRALQPCKNFFADYYEAVNYVIDKAVGFNPNLSLTTFPSFSAEEGIRIVGNEIYYVQLTSSVWYTNQKPDDSVPVEKWLTSHVPTKVFHGTIQHDLAERIKQIYTTAISKAAPSEASGLDGETYRYSTSTSCAETWSPSTGTLDARLVDLQNELATYAKKSSAKYLWRNESAIWRAAKLVDEK